MKGAALSILVGHGAPPSDEEEHDNKDEEGSEDDDKEDELGKKLAEKFCEAAEAKDYAGMWEAFKMLQELADHDEPEGDEEPEEPHEDHESEY